MKYKDVNDWLENCKVPCKYDFAEDTQPDKAAAENDYGDIKDPYEKFFTYMSKEALAVSNYEKGKAGVMECGDDYKKECEEKYGKLQHPDSNSILLRGIYEKLWSDAILKHCKWQDSSVIHGETMNSINTTLGRLYANIETKAQEKERGEIKPKNPHIKTQGISIAYIISRYKKNKRDQKEEYNKVTDFGKFLSVYHTAGNFLPIPPGCNQPRGICLLKDYWDLTLACIYNWYLNENKITKEVKGKHIEYSVSMIFSKEEDLIRYIEWLEFFGEGQGGWNNFVKKNFMQPFVKGSEEKGFEKPRELWAGHFEGSVLPKGNLNQDGVTDFVQFFSNASTWIEERGKLMVKKLDEEERVRIIEADEVFDMDVKIQQFRDFAASGDKEAVNQIADLMGTENNKCIM